jgi:phage/plasmid primase-like uncharacterized protein
MPPAHAHKRQQSAPPPDAKRMLEALQSMAQPREIADGYFQKRGLRGTPAEAIVALVSPFDRRVPAPGVWFCVRDRAGTFTGLHVIWLDDALAAKREAQPRKQSYGMIKSNFILLGTIDADKPLIIAEGVETALTVMLTAGLPAALVGCGTTTGDIDPPHRHAGYVVAGDHDA